MSQHSTDTTIHQEPVEHCRAVRQEDIEEFKAIFGISSIGMAVAESMTGKLMRVNRRLADFLGYTESELVGQSFSTFTHPDDRTKDWEGYARLVSGQIASYEIEKRYLRKDGSVAWAAVSVSVLPSADGTPPRTFALVTDLTNRRNTEQQLGRNEDTFYRLIQNNPFGVYVIDSEFRLREVSLGAKKVFSHVQPLLGRDFAEVLRCVWEEPFATEAIEQFRHTLETGKPFASPSTVERRHDIDEVEAYDWRIERITLPDGSFGVVCYFYDLSERQKWEEELRQAHVAAEQNRAEQQAIVSSMAEGVVIFDAAGNLLDMNEAAVAIHGLESKEPMQNMAKIRPLFELRKMRGEVVPYEEWPISRVMRGEKFTGYEARVRRTDGSKEWIASFGGAPVYDSSGTLTLAVITLRDITKKRVAQEELRYRSEQFKMLLDQAPIGVYLVDADFRVAQVNPVALPVFGEIPDLIGSDFDEVLHRIWPKQDADNFVRIFHRTLETGEPHHQAEFASVRADRGGTEYYNWRINRITLPEGRYGVACYFLDVSEQVRARQAIAQSEERYRTLFSSIDEGFCVIEVLFDDTGKPVDYRFIEINPAFEKHTGLVNAAGKRIRELAPKTEERWYELYGRVVRTGEPVRHEDWFEGLSRWYDVYAFRIGHPDEHKVAVLFTDITERKRAAQQLAAAQAELREHASHLEEVVAERTAKLRETIAELEHFSYTITHDMRAPLRSMQAFGGILRDEYNDRFDEVGRDYLRRITVAANRMDNLITDALNYSKAVQMELMLLPIAPAPLIREIIESYPQFHARGAQIQLEGAFATVLGNKAALTQCFSNILDNAVKFVPANTIPSIRIWAEERRDFIRISFQDNGIGIPLEQHEKVFGMFEKLNAGYPGTGIGLALVRKVVQRMQGQVGFEPTTGPGSCFWVELRKAG